MTYTDIIKKLIGPVHPIGETNSDHDRLNNLGEMMDVAKNLIEEIRRVAENKGAPEHSVNLAGKAASKFLENFKD